jgi:hypothetical protein
MCMALQVLRTSFDWSSERPKPAEPEIPTSPRHLALPSFDADFIDPTSGLKREIVTVDVKAQFVQVKADMPADPPLMLQIYGLETGRHRWTSPFLG